MYLPISLNNFFKPNFQSSQTERFNDQIKTEVDIASELERIENKLKSVISCHQVSK